MERHPTTPAYLDLFFRSVIDWSISDRINTDLALNALTMAY